MWSSSLRFVLCVLVAAVFASAQEAPSPQSGTALVSAGRAALNQYCVTCHDDKLRTAGLTLERSDISRVGADAPLWEKVLDKVRTGTMPPAGLPRPNEATYRSLAGYLE